MQAVRRLSNPQIATVKKDPRLSQSELVAPHIMSLRTLLPQLIALSRALTTRIDGDPTAAGVGTAFRLVAPQLEATFVGWSFTISDVMTGLRESEGLKSKSKHRLGMVVLQPESSDSRTLGAHARTPSTPVALQQRTRVGSFAGSVSLAGSRPASPTQTDLGENDDSIERPRAMVTSRSASSLGFAQFGSTALGRKALGAVRRVPNAPPSTIKVKAMKALSPLDIVIMP